MWILFCFILLCVCIRIWPDDRPGDLNDHEVYFFDEFIDKE